MKIYQVLPILPRDDRKTLSLIDGYIAAAKRYKTVEAICIEMELCGENLRKWLNNQSQIDPGSHKVDNLQIQIFQDMTSGLKYLHENKIIHRDLKPENVMFSKSMFQLPMKICDFGLSRSIHLSESQSCSSLLTSRVGTQDYMAPEAFFNSYSFPADIFSLGLVIWEVVQLIPFSKRTQLFRDLVYDKDELLVAQFEGMDELRDVILNMTKKKVSERKHCLGAVLMILVGLLSPM